MVPGIFRMQASQLLLYEIFRSRWWHEKARNVSNRIYIYTPYVLFKYKFAELYNAQFLPANVISTDFNKKNHNKDERYNF